MKGFIIKCSRWGERICRIGVPGQGHTVLIEATWWRGLLELFRSSENGGRWMVLE